jgi:ElaB/YqjD/DUF883 family membrane-anchored ribosome-binding protein
MENGGRTSGTAAHLKQNAGDLAHNMQDRMEEVRGYAEDAGEWIRQFAREKPIAAIAVAVGVGFVFGRLLSRT